MIFFNYKKKYYIKIIFHARLLPYIIITLNYTNQLFTSTNNVILLLSTSSPSLHYTPNEIISIINNTNADNMIYMQLDFIINKIYYFFP